MKLIKSINSKDGVAAKFLQQTFDGHIIETSYFNLKERIICISTQIGCAMGCVFCATTKPIDKINPRTRFIRNLSDKEICQQVINVLKATKKRDKKPILLSYAGMGEPLLNYENVVNSVKKLSSIYKNIKRATIITCGVSPDNIKRLSREKFNIRVGLQFSLHAPIENLRKKIMPNAGSIKEAFRALRYFSKAKDLPVKINYMLISGVNDSMKDAAALVKLIRGNNFIVKLMVTNKFENYKPSNQRIFKKFKNFLADAGLKTVEFIGDGLDIGASCGQLRRHYYQN